MELVKLSGSTEDKAKVVYSIIKNINTYSRNDQEMKNEIKGIMLVIKNIPEHTLRVMLNLAVDTYPRRKAQDNKLVFDINYILSQYEMAEMLERGGYERECELFDNVEEVEL